MMRLLLETDVFAVQAISPKQSIGRWINLIVLYSSSKGADSILEAKLLVFVSERLPNQYFYFVFYIG